MEIEQIIDIIGYSIAGIAVAVGFGLLFWPKKTKQQRPEMAINNIADARNAWESGLERGDDFLTIWDVVWPLLKGEIETTTLQQKKINGLPQGSLVAICMVLMDVYVTIELVAGTPYTRHI